MLARITALPVWASPSEIMGADFLARRVRCAGVFMLSIKPGRDQVIGLDRLPNPASDDVVIICGFSHGPRSLYRTGSLRQTYPLALPENILYERYRFSSEGIHYFIVVVGHYVDNRVRVRVILGVFKVN